MENKNIDIFTSGVDSEYVLSGLSSYLERENFNVTELDFGKSSFDDKNIQINSKNFIVYITSAHTNLTHTTAEFLAPIFFKKYPNYLAPLDLIPLLKPDLSIYIPHDLLTPYGDTNLNEFRFLDLYDYVLAPYDACLLQKTLPKTTKVIDTGWIKYTVLPNLKDTSQSSNPRISLFISMIEHLRWKYGNEGLLNYLSPLLKENVTIKLPAWHGINELEELIRKTYPQVKVYSAEKSSIDLILESDLVVCNSASSIHAESSLLGKPTVVLLDNEGITVDVQKDKLNHIKNLYLHDYTSRNEISKDIIDELIKQIFPVVLKPFNFEMVKEIITSEYTNKIEI